MEQDRWHRAKQIGGSSESGERSKKKIKKKKIKKVGRPPSLLPRDLDSLRGLEPRKGYGTKNETNDEINRFLLS
jgi:hypothetical protein